MTRAALLLVAIASALTAQVSKATGKVIDSASGKPIAKATVYVNDLNAMTETDAEGRYELPLVRNGAQGVQQDHMGPPFNPVNVRVRAVGYSPRVMVATIGKGVQTLNFSLSRDSADAAGANGRVATIVPAIPRAGATVTRTITGRVIDAASGAPVPAATILVNPPVGPQAVSADADGKYVFRFTADSSTRALTLSARAPGYHTGSPTNVQVFTGTGIFSADFALRRSDGEGAALVAGRSNLVQASARVPVVIRGRIQDATVRAGVGNTLNFVPNATVYINDLNATTQTDAEGQYELVFLVDSGSIGREVLLRARAVGYTPTVVPVRLSRSMEQRVMMAMRQDTSWRAADEVATRQAAVAQQGGAVTSSKAMPSRAVTKMPVKVPGLRVQGGGVEGTERARITFEEATAASRMRNRLSPTTAAPAPAADPFNRFLFPPELVMQYQSDLGLSDAQRTKLQQSIEEAQKQAVRTQWALALENEKLTKMLDAPSVDEKDVLSQMDRIIGIERELKRAQMTLLIQIKNTLTPEQQMRLRRLRDGSDDL